MIRPVRFIGRDDGDLTLIEQHLQVADLLTSLLRSAAERLAITPGSARVIACIHRLSRQADSVVNQAAIARSLRMPKARVNECVKELGDQGLLDRAIGQPGDHRLVHLRLTPSGVATVTKLMSSMLSPELTIRDAMRNRGRSQNLDLLAEGLIRLIELGA